jgi:phosphatidylinositol phospholipase C delta
LEWDNICSFSEGTALEHLNHPENAARYVARNKKQLTRTYPAGFRVTSSNYDPMVRSTVFTIFPSTSSLHQAILPYSLQPMWCGGSQFVALNYQTPSHELDLNFGKFRDNGGVSPCRVC